TPGAQAGPLRGGHHRTDRSGAGHDPGRHLRHARVAPAGRRGVRALLPGRNRDRAPDPGRPGRCAGGDLAGAPRGEARRAAGTGVRVAGVQARPRGAEKKRMRRIALLALLPLLALAPAVAQASTAAVETDALRI